MTQRDDVFKELDEMCVELTTKQRHHVNKYEIVNQTNKAMTAREGLFRLWKAKSDLLDSQCELQIFYKEVAALVGLLGSQESSVFKAFNEACGVMEEGVLFGVEEIEEKLKTHENVEKRVEKQAIEKTEELVRLGEELLVKEKERSMRAEQAEFKVNETYNLQQKLASMIKKQDDVRHVCRKRGRQLTDMLRFCEVRRDIDEFEVWIGEKMRLVRGLNVSAESMVFLNDKVKLFQKQKALCGEVESNVVRYGDLVRRCDEELRVNKTVGRGVMTEAGEELTRKWKELCGELERRAAEFEEARDILEFNDQLGQVEEWLKQKELMLQSGDTGRDYEHCVGLMKRADEAISAGGEEKLREVVEMGDRLVRLGRTDKDSVVERKNRLLEKYNWVVDKMEEYRERLVCALQVHGFNRDYDEIQARLGEKRLLLVSDLDLRTLESVLAAQVKASSLESDLKAIRVRLDGLDNETFQFMSQAEDEGEVVVRALRGKMTETGIQVWLLILNFYWHKIYFLTKKIYFLTKKGSKT